MCGIAGLFDRAAQTSAPNLQAQVQAMTDIIAHRGPDGDGHWVDAEAGIALGHRRLAIIDLSELGRQPMFSANGRWVVTYNGEIFNFQELRNELQRRGAKFRGTSDTEVMLAAIEDYGLAATIDRLIGMFAIALWDRQRRELHLVRDRLGIKPLYWGTSGLKVYFASQPKAILVNPDFDRTTDRDALAACLRYAYIPAPRTAWTRMAKLPPAHHLTIDAEGRQTLRRYWDLDAIATSGCDFRLDEDDEALTERYAALLGDAVERRMVADVPLGAFLSGGIDSSAVVALMQRASNRPIKTFTIAWGEAGYNEAAEARAIAANLGTDHREIPVNPNDALALVPRLPDYFDEPFADSSMIPTYFVAEAARREVTVALSGDGGDEVFQGYTRYRAAPQLARRLGWVSRDLRRGLAAAITALSPAQWDRLFALVPATVRPRLAGERLHKLAGALPFADPDDLYGRLVSQWTDAERLIPSALGPTDPAHGRGRGPRDFAERMQWLDQATYLPDDILAKVDRASMAVGLEARVPLLDHRVVELAWRLPAHARSRAGKGKWLLRRILERQVPASLVERPKMGFAAPVDSWLRGPLRDWAGDLLSPAALAADGLFDPEPITRRFAEHLSGQRNWQHGLWAVLMIQAWRRRWA